jgi:hypothetical protein
MSEKKDREEKEGKVEKEEAAGPQSAGKGRRGAKKPASAKEAAPRGKGGVKAAGDRAAKASEEAEGEKRVGEEGKEKEGAAPEKPVESGVGAETSEKGKTGDGAEAPGREEELTEEEFRRLLEEQMEKITVKDVVSQMMASLASLAYQKLGLPESVNLKYRDFAQARMAIDALKGLLSSLEGKLEEGELSPFRGTLANLQMNYVRLVKPGG